MFPLLIMHKTCAPGRFTKKNHDFFSLSFQSVLVLQLTSREQRVKMSYQSLQSDLTTEMDVQYKRDFARLEFDTLRPRRNCRHFADNIFKCIV